MAIRYSLGDDIPELINAEQLKGLIRQYLGEGVGYVVFRQMVESGLIPSRAHPFRDVSKFGSRRYNWPDVKAALDARSFGRDSNA